MNNIVDYVKNNVVVYKNESEFLKYNGYEKDDFEDWKQQGHSADGFVQVMDCYCLAGNATTGKMAKITDFEDITDLILTEIEESDFMDTVAMLNDDVSNDKENPCYIEPNNTLAVMEAFFEYCDSSAGEISIFMQDDGGYCLVINED